LTGYFVAPDPDLGGIAEMEDVRVLFVDPWQLNSKSVDARKDGLRPVPFWAKP